MTLFLCKFRHAAEYMAAIIVGGVVYGAIETVCRGYTHPSMLVTGGLCFAGLYAIEKRTHMKLLPRALVGALLITAAEFAAGCICNLWLGWDVWDYSHLHPNLWGQICLPFTVLWALLSVPAYYLASMLHAAIGDQAPAPSSDTSESPDASPSDSDLSP